MEENSLTDLTPNPPKKLQLTNTGKHPLGRGKSTKISHIIGQISLFIGMGMRDSELHSYTYIHN